MAKVMKARGHRVGEPAAISEIQVAGFKSIRDEQSIEIRPLTILAGANSSGKSSIMQPVLLLKQTLEATYDPGPLLLNGPNLKFTSADQMLFRNGKSVPSLRLCVGIGLDNQSVLKIRFRRESGKRLDLHSLQVSDLHGVFEVSPRLSIQDIESINNESINAFRLLYGVTGRSHKWDVVRERCFFVFRLLIEEEGETALGHRYSPGDRIEPCLRDLIHLPGLRGNPERTYPVTGIGPSFPGTFEKYTASVIAAWASEKKEDKLEQLGDDLKTLGLTWKVVATAVDDTQVELQVGRLPRPARGGTHDLVNVADVGFGVSQILPVVTALLAAQPGQLVYLEQPEIHLHPHAQFVLAEVLASAAKRGVRVVVETHSSILLLGVQALVAEGNLDPDKVKLHWFQREGGRTIVHSGDLDETGAFGEWPEDFDDEALRVQKKYIDAASKRLFAK